MRGTKVDDTGPEMRGVRVFLEGLGRGYVHPPAFRIVFKTRGLLNLIVVSDSKERGGKVCDSSLVTPTRSGQARDWWRREESPHAPTADAGYQGRSRRWAGTAEVDGAGRREF